MKINYTNKTIELTKVENRKASTYGSDMYNDLKNAQRDYPTFKIVIKSPSKRTNQIKGLDYEYMKKYIETYDKDSLDEFNKKIAKAKDTEGLKAYYYGDVKKWFLDKYPEIKNYCEKKSA